MATKTEKVYVYICDFKTRTIWSAMGPMGEREADRVERGALINMNTAAYFIADSPRKFAKGDKLPRKI